VIPFQGGFADASSTQRVAHRAAEVGLASLGVALSAALLLVLGQTLDDVTAWVVTAGAAALVGATWLGWPMVTRTPYGPRA
jgi:hypothetical protein